MKIWKKQGRCPNFADYRIIQSLPYVVSYKAMLY